MPVADGNVEIRVTGSVDPSVAASANAAAASFTGLTVQQASLAKAVIAGEVSLDALSKTLGRTAEAQKTMAAITAAVAAAKATDTAATIAETAATEVNTHAALNSRSVYEGLALVHEAMAGRYTRMASTSLIFGQAVAGQSAVLRVAQFATSAYGLAILGTVATVGLLIAATISEESEEKKLIATMVGLGAQSGLTAEQMKKIGESANSASQSVRETTKAAEAFAASGLSDEQTVKTLSNSIEAYSQLVGVKFAQAEKNLAAAMKDPVKGAKELHDQLGILNGDQMQQIETLVALGHKEEAAAIITQALKERLDEARTAGVGLRGEFGQLIDTLSNVYNSIGQVTEGFGREAETLLEDLIPALHQTGQAHRDASAAAKEQAQNEATLNTISAKGRDAYDKTPEGRAAKERADLQGNLSAAKDALAVDKALVAQGKEKADVLVRDQQTIADYSHAVGTYRTEVEKKVAIDKIDVELAAAKHSHNRKLVQDLTDQKALMQESGKIESDADARALALGKGEVAGAKTFAPKGGKGPSVVSQWEEQLHAAEVLSNNFFEDQTAAELKFWQSKVGAVKAGSKDWLEVQTKIYEAQKSLAHRDYAEHIADLNDKLEADRNDQAKFKADWQEKLDYIRSKFKEESTEYKDAHRQMLAEERQFEDRMIQEELTGNNKAIAALRQHLAAQQSIRSEYAKIAETKLQDKGSTSPFGDIQALAKIGQMHHQLALQEIRDAEVVHNQEEALLQKGLADALKAYGTEDQRYKNAVADKHAADQKYYDQKRQLELKALNQQLQDIQRLKAAYHQYIDGTVQATVSGFANMADGTGTWRDAVIGIYNSIKSAAEQVISQIIENWIVNLLVGKAQQSTTAEAQVLSYSGVAGAAGVASYAAAPWPIDMGAPAFGAAMAGAAAAFAPQAALAQGTNYLPKDMVVQAHEGERVIPKADNTKLIQILSMASGGAGKGDIHLHSSPVFNGNQSSLWQHMVDKHERDMIRWMKRQFVNGPLRPQGA